MHPLSVSCLFESCHAAYCLCVCVSTWIVVIVLYLFRLSRPFSVQVRFAGLSWAGAAEVRLQPSGVQRDFLFQGWRRALPARLGRLQALMIGPVIGGCPNTAVALACASPVVLDRFRQCGPVFFGTLGLQNVQSTLWFIVVGHFPPFVVLAICMSWPGYVCPRQVGAERARIVQEDA